MPKGVKGFQKGHPVYKGAEKGWFKKLEVPNYFTIHHWVRKHKTKTGKCANLDCVYPRLDARNVMMDKPKRTEWASISRKALQDLNDYVELCTSCHRRYDME
jgi:hypothetical protein